nr:hypothetical protein [Xenorhabdus bovienii]
MNPAGDGSVVNLNPSLRHHFLEIAQAQGVGQIPTNTLGNDIDRIMEAFKRVSDQGHRSGLAQKQGSLPDDRLMRQNHIFNQQESPYHRQPCFIIWLPK